MPSIIGQFPLKHTKTVKMYTFFCGLKCTFPAYYVRIPRMVLNIVWNGMNNDCNIATSNNKNYEKHKHQNCLTN